MAAKEEPKKETLKEEPPKKPGLFAKLKDAAEDKEEQMAILSTFVRLGILCWSGAILTLAYVELPSALRMPKQDLDPTFIASVFTGVLASFGIQTASKKGDGTMKMSGGSGPNGNISKADMEKLIDKATQAAPVQTIRLEQAPLVINSGTPKKT